MRPRFLIAAESGRCCRATVARVVPRKSDAIFFEGADRHHFVVVVIIHGRITGQVRKRSCRQSGSRLMLEADSGYLTDPLGLPDRLHAIKIVCARQEKRAGEPGGGRALSLMRRGRCTAEQRHNAQKDAGILHGYLTRRSPDMPAPRREGRVIG
jgi:hypothetical protein